MDEEFLSEMDRQIVDELLNEMPDVQARPDALTGGVEQLDQEGLEFDSMWSRYYPKEVPFFKLVLMDKLRSASYHMTVIEGKFDMKKIMTTYRGKIYRSETLLTESGNLKVRRLLIVLADGVFAYFEDDFSIYAPTQRLAAQTARDFEQFLMEPDPEIPHFHIISNTYMGPEWTQVQTERAQNLTSDERALHYGDDFPEWENAWLAQLKSRPSGLSILYGPPGCGKTFYLRGLLNQLIDQYQVCYLPVSQAEVLSDSRYVNFWLENKELKDRKKIVILEDAEELLLPRDAGSRDKVSTLLNVSDGFIGDFLKVQVIATTNAPAGNLDPAILRPGRLMGLREFRRLNRTEAERLAQAKNLTLPDQPDYSLAEIYCHNTSATTNSSKQRQVGFV